MLVRLKDDIIGDVQAYDIRQVLSYLSRQVPEFSSLLDDKFWIVIRTGETFVPLHQEVITTPLTSVDEIIFLDSVEGAEPMSLAIALSQALAASAFSMGGTMGSMLLSVATSNIFTYAAAFVIGAVESFVMGEIMQLISPTPEMTKDPADVQVAKSNLFNLGTTTKEQGGPVPIAVGNPYCSGTLISVSLMSADINREETL